MELSNGGVGKILEENLAREVFDDTVDALAQSFALQLRAANQCEAKGWKYSKEGTERLHHCEGCRYRTVDLLRARYRR